MVSFKPLTVEQFREVEPKVGCVLSEDMKSIGAFDVKGNIVAAAIMDSWTYTTVQIHIWIGNPAVITKGFLREIAHYIFDTAGRKIAIGLVPGNNEKSLAFIKEIGFKPMFTIKDGYKEGVDYHIVELRKEWCVGWFYEEAA